jgi:hypothetical protein
MRSAHLLDILRVARLAPRYNRLRPMIRAPAPYPQIFVATLILVAVLAIEPRPMIQQTATIVLAIWLSWAASIRTRRRHDFRLLLVLGVTPAILELVLPWEQGPLVLDLLKASCWIGFPLVLAQKLFADLYRARDITHHELFGVVSVYVFFGLAYANGYELLEAFHPGSLNFVTDVSPPDFADFLYFSFVTLGTVGYGDVSPVTHGARLLAMSQALIGVMYIAVVVGRIVGLHTARAAVGPDAGESAPGPPPGGSI